MTNKNHYSKKIARVSMAKNLGRMVISLDGLLPILSHDTLIMWPCDTRFTYRKRFSMQTLNLSPTYFNLLGKIVLQNEPSKLRGIMMNLDYHANQKMQNISKRTKTMLVFLFFQKHLYQMIKITESNKGAPSFVFSIILLENHIYLSFQKFEEISL